MKRNDRWTIGDVISLNFKDEIEVPKCRQCGAPKGFFPGLNLSVCVKGCAAKNTAIWK